MVMRHQPSTRVAITLLVVGALIAGCGTDATEPGPLATISTLPGSAVDLPPDMAATGMEVAPIMLEDAISQSDAIAIAAKEYGLRYEGGVVDAYLVSLTDPGTLGGESPIRDRAVWLVHYSGLAIPYTGPIMPDGTPAEGGTIDEAYVVLDAITGEWLFTQESG